MRRRSGCSAALRASCRTAWTGARECSRRCRALRARPDAAADRALRASSSATCSCRRRSMRRPSCCSAEIRARAAYLCDVGLGYLTLDRQSRTLSGGEVQRINLTTALGTSLVNTLFVLDEPSIGLHPRDMQRVIGVMQRLRDAGNTLVVVEHDPQIMLEADRILDMGPGRRRARRRDRLLRHAGARSRAHRSSLTGRVSERSQAGAAAGDERRAARRRRRRRVDRRGALQPLARARRRARAQPQEHRRAHSRCKRLVCVTGVSGSGKSTLVQDVLYPALLQVPRQAHRGAGRVRGLDGRRARSTTWCMVDQTPDRPHHALESGQLRRRLRCDPRAVRRGARRAGAQVHRRHLQLQLRQRPLPDLRRQWLRARRDAVPLGRVPALPGLRRHAATAPRCCEIRREGANGRRAEHRRRAAT